jgi:hypothetical protein
VSEKNDVLGDGMKKRKRGEEMKKMLSVIANVWPS